MHELLHIVEHAFLDTIKLIPFLFLAYLLMECMEHKMGDKTKKAIKKSGKLGPLFGGILGVFPQCGFSAAAANLYAGRVITVGTLLAIFLSTSDEMLPIFISEQVDPVVIVKILGIKLLIGVVAGFLIDAFMRGHHKEEEEMHIHDLCDHDHCHCEKGVFQSAIVHTLKITVFIFAVTFVLGGVVEIVGEETLSALILDKPLIGPIVAGLVGFIPNCAASVIITQLYLEGMLSLGAMLAGLLVGAGVGILVLFRENSDMKDNFKIALLLYAIGVGAGIVLEFLGLTI